MTTLTTSLVVRLMDQVTRPARTVSQSLLGIRRAADSANGASFGRRLTDAVNTNQRALDRARGSAFEAVAGFYALREAIRAPVGAAIEFESAMADIRKVVDFVDDDQFDDFGRQLRALSESLPVAAGGLADIAAAAGEAGIAREDILKFTEAAAKIGVAFGISADEAGSSMAKLMTGLGMTLDEVVLLSDGMNELSNSQASSAREILDVVRRVGAQGKQFGFAADEVAAFASAMIASGSQSEVAATSFRNMGRALTMGESAPKRLSDGLEKLGLTSEDVARRMQEDAVATTIDVLDRIGKLPAEMQASVSNDVFGGEARALGPLLTNLDLLRDTLGIVGDESDVAGSAFREFEVRAKTFGSQVQVFRNRMTSLGIVIGNAIIPALSDLMETLQPVVTGLIEFTEANPDLVKNVVAATAAIMGFKFAMTGLRFVGLLGRGGALSLLSIGFNTVGRAAIGLHNAAAGSIALQRSLAGMSGATVTRTDKIRAALMGIARVTGLSAVASGVMALAGAVATISAPVWLGIAAAAAAIGAAGTLIYREWDRISAIVRGVASAVGEALEPALEAARPALEMFADLTAPIKEAWDGLLSAVRTVIDSVKGFFSGDPFARNILSEDEKQQIEARARDMARQIIDAIGGLPRRLMEIGRDAIQSLLNGMKERFEELIEWVRAIPGRIKDAIGSIDLSGIVKMPGPGPVLTRGDYNRSLQDREPVDGVRAFGGPVTPGRYMVGERGPEIVDFGQAGRVRNAAETRRMLAEGRSFLNDARSGSGGASGPVTVNVPVTINGVQDIRGAAREIGRIIEEEVGLAVRGLHRNGGDI